MIFPKLLVGAVALGLSCTTLNAADLMIMDSYFRTSGPTAKSGAAFMHIINHTSEDDVLISATSDIAKKVELHTHIDAGEGVMLMREDEDGFPIPAGGMHMLKRGGDHVMFMGLSHGVATGDFVTVTLTFEKAGEITVEIPVDLERKPAEGEMKIDDSSDG